MEKQHVFEFIGKVLGTEKATRRLLDEESFYGTIDNLTTKLKSKESNDITLNSPFEDQDLNEWNKHISCSDDNFSLDIRY